jgi:hypothetical protein
LSLKILGRRQLSVGSGPVQWLILRVEEVERSALSSQQVLL